MGILVSAPLLIPLVSSLLLYSIRRRHQLTQIFAIFAATLLLLVSLILLVQVSRQGILVVAIGNWPPPYGIVLVADFLSAIMIVVCSLVSWATLIYATAWVDFDRQQAGFYSLIYALLLGVNGAFLTGDLFNLYVWFEVMLMASFVLLVLGVERGQVEGGIKYVTLNLLASTFFLSALGLLYGITGTLNLAHLSPRIQAIDPTLLNLVALLFGLAFGIKAGVFPLFFWLPASYHTPPVPASALFAGLLTKVGVYALLRIFTLVFIHEPGWTHQILLVTAALTMLTGVLGALAQHDVRRILSFHIVSQIGYMVFGLALLTPLGLAASIFYVAHHIIVKTNLFLIGGLIERTGRTSSLFELGGLFRARPWLGLLFLIPAFSLAGIPPLSGFWAKLLILRAGLDARAYGTTAIALLVGLFTLLSMLKIWNEVFWKPSPQHHDVSQGKIPLRLLLPSLALAAVTVWIGLSTDTLLRLSSEAARQLFDQELYRTTILGHAVIMVPTNEGGMP